MTAGILHPYPVAYISHAFSEIHNHTDVAYAFVTDKPPKYPIDDSESKDIRLVSASELKKLPASSIPANVKEAGLFILEVCLEKWQKVPTTFA
jgi:hypothetical protein